MKQWHLKISYIDRTVIDHVTNVIENCVPKKGMNAKKPSLAQPWG